MDRQNLQNQTGQDVQLNKYDQGRADTAWNKIKYYLVKVWPYLQSLLNFLIYETIKIGRGAVRIAIEQIKR